MKAIFSHVSREIFNELCDRLCNKYGFAEYVDLHYDGTSNCGTVTIVMSRYHRNEDEYKNALIDFIDIYTNK